MAAGLKSGHQPLALTPVPKDAKRLLFVSVIRTFIKY
jgi:hypothetical protein